MIKYVSDCYTTEGPLFEYRNHEDGNLEYSFHFFVECVTQDGMTFTHCMNFDIYDQASADRLVSRINERGCINLDHWFEGTVWDMYKTEQTHEEEKEQALWSEYND